MPVRIKPIQELRPCVLTLEGIQEIIGFVDAEFDTVNFIATDGIWEIFDEPKADFLSEIEKKESLDSFILNAKSSQDDSELEIVFSESTAHIKFAAPAAKEKWYQRFLRDVDTTTLKATFAQTLVHKFDMSDVYFRLSLLLFAVPIRFNSAYVPYCSIVIKKRPPNPFVENIKANLVSNTIWFVLTVVLTLAVQWVLNSFGIDLTPWN